MRSLAKLWLARSTIPKESGLAKTFGVAQTKPRSSSHSAWRWKILPPRFWSIKRQRRPCRRCAISIRRRVDNSGFLFADKDLGGIQSNPFQKISETWIRMKGTKYRARYNPMKRAGMFLVGAFQPLKCCIVIPERDIDAGNFFTGEVVRRGDRFDFAEHAFRIISSAHTRIRDGDARLWDTGDLGSLFIKFQRLGKHPFF